MFTETYLESQDVGTDLIRKLLSTLDRPVFALLGVIYQLFFNVASADILSAGVSRFYQRVQLIIGVFMMFQLAMTIIKGIINPDNFTDSKSGGGSVIFRICTALVMLALIVPINISSASNEYEKQINNNGLLFGTLYSLQHRILANNTIGRLVMGVRENDNNYLESNNQDELKKSADIFTSTILKGFYRINLVPEKERVTKKGQEADQILENRMCQDIDNDIIKEYSKIDSDPGVIISAVNETCEPEFNFRNHIPGVSSFFGTKKYAFTYMPVVSFIIGIIFVVILLSFTIDIAVRTVKLAVLRLIAPIPIISYMDPKGSKDGSFNAWVKALTSTYLDLFIRIAAVYFVIFIIQEMIVNGVVVSNATGIIGVFTWILIWVGLFYFAKEAPKFIREVLGLKGEGTSLFSGFGKIMGAAAIPAGVLGMAGSAATNWRAASEENKELHPGQNRRNFGRNLVSAIAGGVGGGAAGMKAAFAKDSDAKSVLAAQNQRNARRAAHSTAPGRAADSLYGMFTGQSLADRHTGILDANKEAFKSLKNWKNSVKDEAAKNGGAFDYTLANGIQLNGITYDQVRAAKQAGADQNGQITINGSKYDASDFGDVVLDDIADKQVAAWQAGNTRTGKTYRDVVTGDGKLSADHERVIKAVTDAAVVVQGPNGTVLKGENLVDSYNDLGAAMGVANRTQQAEETSMRQIMRRANNQQKK